MHTYIYIYPHKHIYVYAYMLVSCIWLSVARWTVAYQAPLSMEFSRQEYWSILHFYSVLEWVAIPFYSESSQPRNWTHVSCIAGRFSTIWVTREALYASVHPDI